MGNCNGIFTTCQNEDGQHVGTVDKENMKKAYLANKAGGQELDDSYDQSFAKSGTVDFKQVSRPTPTQIITIEKTGDDSNFKAHSLGIN